MKSEVAPPQNLESAVQVLRQRNLKQGSYDRQPFVFLSGPSGAGKTQHDVLFALRNRALLFVAMADLRWGSTSAQSVIDEMLPWSRLLHDFAKMDISALRELLPSSPHPGLEDVVKSLSARNLSFYAEKLPSFVLGFVSALMTRFPNGFPINSSIKALEVGPQITAVIAPMTITAFRSKHPSVTEEWSVIIDESPSLREWNDAELTPSQGYRVDAQPALFVRNLLRAAGIIPILSGTSASLANVVDFVGGSGGDGLAKPFAYIIPQQIGCPPNVVKRWTDELRDVLPDKGQSPSWAAFVEWFRGACATGNPRFAIHALDTIKDVCLKATQQSRLAQIQPVDLLSGILSRRSFLGMRALKFQHHPPSSLFGQIALVLPRPPDSEDEWRTSSFIHTHFALLHSKCRGLLNSAVAVQGPRGSAVAVYDYELSDSSVSERAFHHVVASRFPRPAEDPLMYLLALSNAPGAEALRIPAFNASDFTARCGAVCARASGRGPAGTAFQSYT